MTGVRGASIYKVVYFFPQVLSVAIIGIVFKYVFAPENAGGILNRVLGAVGLDGLQRLWLAEPNYLIWIVVLVMTWSFVGFYVVLFSAAMQSIPRDIYEAALLDGSSRLTTFRKITVPLVWDTVQVGWVYMAIQAMDGFATVHIMLASTAAFRAPATSSASRCTARRSPSPTSATPPRSASSCSY